MIQAYSGDTIVRSINADKFTIDVDGYTVEFYYARNQEWNMPYGNVLDGKMVKAPLQVIVS